jgi:hypothetical protein
MSLLDLIGCRLKTDDEAATANRLFKSKHVQDLRLIINVTLWAVLLSIPIGLVVSFEYQVVSNWPLIDKHPSDWVYVHLAFAAAASLLAWLAPALAVVGAVLAWAYQIGSARLGVVDLFACEVSTLCRIVTILDTVRRFTDTFRLGSGSQAKRADMQSSSPHFTSQEEYFPVFENNTAALQTLEARVVVNITAFYTYMKAMRDSMRALAEITAAAVENAAPAAGAAASGPWHDTARNVIYVLFLGLESARKAVDDLVEFDPEKAERTIVILISELEAYRFLREQFNQSKDIRHERIVLRISQYKSVVPQVQSVVRDGRAKELIEADRPDAPVPPKASQWEAAYLLLDELDKRYRAAVA